MWLRGEICMSDNKVLTYRQDVLTFALEQYGIYGLPILTMRCCGIGMGSGMAL